MTELLEKKKEMRADICTMRAKLTQEEIDSAAAAALVRLLMTREYQECHSIFTYVSYQQELSTLPLLQAAFLDSKVVAVPKVIRKRHMEFYRINSIKMLYSGFMGIPEPKDDTEALLPDTHSLILLPGVAFSAAGKRLGYGGGYYDTWLSRQKVMDAKPALAGYAYDFQICNDNDFPAEPHDQSVGLVVTPTRTIYTAPLHL